MPCSLIHESTRLLGIPRTDLVLGPCEDGGYYLIGLKKPTPELFRESRGARPGACVDARALTAPWGSRASFSPPGMTSIPVMT